MVDFDKVADDVSNTALAVVVKNGAQVLINKIEVIPVIDYLSS